MARTSPIPEREIQICERLRQARHASLFSQVVFARLLGIEGNTLTSYELGRVPIRFGLACNAAAIAGISLRWLATGEQPRNFRLALDKKILDRINEKELFSKAYDTWLKGLFDAEIENLAALTGGKLDEKSISKFQSSKPHNFVGVVGPDDVLRQVESLLKLLLWSIPPHLYQEIYSDIGVTVSQFHRRHLAEIDKFPKNKLPKFPLTKYPLTGSSDAVKPILPKLIERLKKATNERGCKTKLAEWLGVSPQKVSDWISQRVEPSGETTLQLLHWVEQQERQ